MTLCKKLGYKEGDRFEVVGGSYYEFSKGSIVELYEDDGSANPLFKLIQGSCEYNHVEDGPVAYTDLSDLKKIGHNLNTQGRNMYKFNVSSLDQIDLEEIANETTIQNPISYVEYQGKEYAGFFIIHRSLAEKAANVKMDHYKHCDYTINNHLVIYCSVPQTKKQWLSHFKKVRKAQWKGEKGNVTVEKLEL